MDSSGKSFLLNDGLVERCEPWKLPSTTSQNKDMAMGQQPAPQLFTSQLAMAQVVGGSNLWSGLTHPRYHQLSANY